MFALQDETEREPRSDPWVEDLDLTGEASHDRRRGVAHFDLTLLVKITARGLHCKLEYAQDMFDAATVQSILESFGMVLQSVGHLPHRSVAALEVIGSADRDRQLTQWNHSSTSFQQEKCVYELFERQVELTPDAIALVHESCALSFRELNNRANFLARKILGFDLPLETKVGLHFERSIETVITVVAVIKAGLCYVPLDPSHPLERTRFTAADANVRLILSNADRLDWSLRDHYSIVNVPHALRSEYQPGTEYTNIPRSAIGLRPENLVYCLYTSGSTGRPKGVMVTHAALANLCVDSIRRRGFNGECRNLQFAPLVFDAASAEIFNSLLSGSILHIPPTNVLTSAEEFKQYSKRHAINRGYIPPAFLSILDSRDFASYRSLSVGGEAIGRDIAKQWSQVCTLTNAYGPTECTIACTSGILDGSDEVSIGSFIDNVSGYVLNDALQLVPSGAVGELCIGGVCLARGYASDRKLTAEKFIPDPFATKPGSRLYRTGDLVRYRRDGNLEFLGRRDQQIKLRGHRVELSEIEAHVMSHPAVSAAVASVQGEASDKRIVVHYTLHNPESTLGAVELRAFAQQALPHYMVPSAFAKVREFPLTQSGKVDRKSLPTITDEHMRCDFVAPIGELETRVAALWAEKLAVSSVGRFDNFFELGGHSLLAAQLIAVARERLSANVTVRDLFESQSLERFAAVLEKRISSELPVPWRRSGASPTERAALSPAQRRLWFLHKLIGPNSVFNVPVALKLEGNLNPERLTAAITRVLERHDVLRSRFVEVSGEPRAVIDVVPAKVLRTFAIASDEEWRRVCLAERTTLFDLSADALYRFCLISIGGPNKPNHDQSWVLHLTLHHIICDGHSIGIMLREIAAHYNANASSENVLPFQYGEFATWQSGPENKALYESQLTYWREALKELPPTLNMPLDFQRPREQTYNGATRRLHVPHGVRERLKALSKAHHATLFMTLISAFALLLGRYARQSHFAIGTPISSRELPGSERVIGLFLNMLVLRFDLNTQQSFADLLQATRTTALDAYLHQDVPFEILVEHLNPERDLSHAPFFQVSFSMVENPLSEVRLNDLNMTLLEPDGLGTVARYELSLSFTEVEDGLLGMMEYNSDLFAADTIEQMLAHYRLLLEAIVDAPDSRIAQLDFLSANERQLQLAVWNRSNVEMNVERNVYQLLETRVAEEPDAIAVGCDGHYYSYRQLDHAAHAIASALQARGCGGTSRVGMALDRSFEMLAAVLGCLRSGITYVPLDLQLPPARIAYIAADAKLDLVIGDIADACASGRRISMTQLTEIICGHSGELNATPTSPANLAYIIYTSGSTGKPKGVGVSHRNLINLVKAMLCRPGIQKADRMLAVTTLSFDIAFLELFVPIAAGGMVEIARSEEVYDGKKLVRKVAACSISCMQATPSTWKLMLDAGWCWTAALKALVGGEALSRELAGRLQGNVEQLWNMYGPTETTIWSTAKLINGSRVDIGRPVRSTTAYVLSESLDLLPIGVVGELYIGGEGVAQGYVERPSLTAARFVPNPFADEMRAGSRLYRTGDLVRYRDDGNLEYIGREDHQVKIRGHRIELGEIESVIAEHPAVKEAVVVASKGKHADEYLAAYIVLHAHRDEARSGIGSEMRDIAQRSLPRYMVPSAFVVLDALPLTPNGKLDRKALPAPEAVTPATEYVAPRDQFEKRIATIWADILKRDRIGLTDNFFELGGHSLLVTQVASRIEKEFEIAISLKDFYEFASLQAISARVNQLSAIDAVKDDLVEQLSDDEVGRLLSEIESLETMSTHDVCER
jgi:amino acid adenylation domain-containing protein